MPRRYAKAHPDEKMEYKVNVRSLLLSAHDGHEAKSILGDLFTEDERIKIGKRVSVAALLVEGMSYREIMDTLGVGLSTIATIARKLERGGAGFELVFQRLKEELSQFKELATRLEGGSKQAHKRTRLTGFTSLDVGRKLKK